MSQEVIKKGSLVLYKIRPAIVTDIGEKITIQLEANKAKRVRAKDISLIHPGPLVDIKSLTNVLPDIQETWELLEGEITNLPELCELLFNDYTPDFAWSTWLCVTKGIYFEGKPDRIVTRSQQQVDESLEGIRLKQAEEDEKRRFFENIQAATLNDEDKKKLSEVEMVALDKADKSQILKSLDIKQDRASAHRFLIKCGYWAADFNPYPARNEINMSQLDFPVTSYGEEDRADLTSISAFAIDDVGSNDPDDAISLHDGVLWVHIADVAAIVSHDSAIDKEASERGANLYLPEDIIHMLPRDITEQLGLGLHEKSPALSIGFKVSENGELSDIKIVLSWIKVTRLTYAEADQQLNSTFSEINQLCQSFRARRIENQASEINLPEVSVKVRDNEISITPLDRLLSRQLVSDAMLMAGYAVATFCHDKEIPIPYAMQPEPTEISYPETLSEMYAYRRQFKASKITLEPEKHFGLGLDMYTRVTSPLRRYLDLVVHQQLRLFLSGIDVLTSEEISSKIMSVSQKTMSIRKAERFSNLHWKLIYLQRNPHWQGDAVVVDIDERKVTILIPELAMESKMRVRDGYSLNEKIKIKINTVDLPDQTASFARI